MSTVLSPIESEFNTVEQADSYDRWFRAKVQASLDSKNPRRHTTDEVMRRMSDIIKTAKAKQCK